MFLSLRLRSVYSDYGGKGWEGRLVQGVVMPSFVARCGSRSRSMFSRDAGLTVQVNPAALYAHGQEAEREKRRRAARKVRH